MYITNQILFFLGNRRCTEKGFSADELPLYVAEEDAALEDGS